MFHDPGHIPMKLLGFDEGVNVSIGLPITRERSLIAAIDLAVQMVEARQED